RLAARNAGWLELAGPGWLHLRVVLLGPSGLGLGHLRQNQKVTAFRCCLQITFVAVNVHGFEQCFDDIGLSVVVQRVVALIIDARKSSRPIVGIVGFDDGKILGLWRRAKAL